MDWRFIKCKETSRWRRQHCVGAMVAQAQSPFREHGSGLPKQIVGSGGVKTKDTTLAWVTARRLPTSSQTRLRISAAVLWQEYMKRSCIRTNTGARFKAAKLDELDGGFGSGSLGSSKTLDLLAHRHRSPRHGDGSGFSGEFGRLDGVGFSAATGGHAFVAGGGPCGGKWRTNNTFQYKTRPGWFWGGVQYKPRQLCGYCGGGQVGWFNRLGYSRPAKYCFDNSVIQTPGDVSPVSYQDEPPLPWRELYVRAGDARRHEQIQGLHSDDVEANSKNIAAKYSSQHTAGRVNVSGR